MRKRMLNINEIEVTNKPVIYTCYGLGSCIGLFVTDNVKGLSGAAHIAMPHTSEESEFMDATSLINELLLGFSEMGSDLNSLRAKVTGGAQVYGNYSAIGPQNAEVVLKQLVDRKIFIAATDVGGNISRTARFNSNTGDLEISTSEQKKYSI